MFSVNSTLQNKPYQPSDLDKTLAFFTGMGFDGLPSDQSYTMDDYSASSNPNGFSIYNGLKAVSMLGQPVSNEQTIIQKLGVSPIVLVGAIGLLAAWLIFKR